MTSEKHYHRTEEEIDDVVSNVVVLEEEVPSHWFASPAEPQLERHKGNSSTSSASSGVDRPRPTEASVIVPRPRQHGQRDLQELSAVMHSALLTMSHAEKFFKHATKAFEEEGRKMQLAVDKVDTAIRMGR